MNTKKAYRLYIEASGESNPRDRNRKLFELACLVGISISEKALDPRNVRVLARQEFWFRLKEQITLIINAQAIPVLRESGELHEGKETCSSNRPREQLIVTKIREDGISCKDSSGGIGNGWNLLLMNLNFEVLPGDDPEGRAFWKDFRSHQSASK